MARAFDARDAPTTEFVAAARAVDAGLCVAPRTTFDAAARAVVALRATGAVDIAETVLRTVPLRPVTTFVFVSAPVAERATVVLGRLVALRDTFVVPARPVTDDTALSATAELTRTTRPLFVRDVAFVVAVPPFVSVPPPRGFGACAPQAAPTVTNATANINEILKRLTMRIVKTYISLVEHFIIFRAIESTTKFTLCNNLLHFLPNFPNAARRNAIEQLHFWVFPVIFPLFLYHPHILHRHLAQFS